MGEVDYDQFDDELRTMQELMEQNEIALQEKDLNTKLENLNLRRAVVVESGSTVRDCIDLMLARHFGCLLVVADGKLAGIFTERDVLMKIAGLGLNLEAEKIDDYMTREPATRKMDDTVLSALRVMHQGQHRHVAVVDRDDNPAAVLSVRDVMNYVVEFFPQDVLNLPPHPIRVGTKHRHGG